MDMYREEILEHYKHPHNFGELTKPTVSVREANASCGDLIELQLLIRDRRIVDVRFQGVGCALSIASASLLTDHLKDTGVAEASKFNEQSMLDMFGIEVSSMRRKCVALPLRALKLALEMHA